MEKVFFVCLLTMAITLGVSKADEIPKPPIAAHDQMAPNETVPDANNPTLLEPNEILANTTTNNSTSNKHDKSTAKTEKPPTPEVGTGTPVNVAESEIVNETTKPNNTATIQTNVTDKADTATIVNPIINNATKAGVKDNSTKTTTTEVTAKAMDPEMADASKTVVTQSSFHGPSFIGGIVLTLGLLAIGFMGLKYYRAQTERNYHTL